VPRCGRACCGGARVACWPRARGARRGGGAPQQPTRRPQPRPRRPRGRPRGAPRTWPRASWSAHSSRRAAALASAVFAASRHAPLLQSYPCSRCARNIQLVKLMQYIPWLCAYAPRPAQAAVEAAREAAADAARRAEWEGAEAAALQGTVRDLQSRVHSAEQGGAQARARAAAGSQQGGGKSGDANTLGPQGLHAHSCLPVPARRRCIPSVACPVAARAHPRQVSHLPCLSGAPTDAKTRSVAPTAHAVW